jgi:hypothetical protein
MIFALLCLSFPIIDFLKTKIYASRSNLARNVILRISECEHEQKRILSDYWNMNNINGSPLGYYMMMTMRTLPRGKVDNVEKYSNLL